MMIRKTINRSRVALLSDRDPNKREGGVGDPFQRGNDFNDFSSIPLLSLC
jgi:hypothetical protein